MDLQNNSYILHLEMDQLLTQKYITEYWERWGGWGGETDRLNWSN